MIDDGVKFTSYILQCKVNFVWKCKRGKVCFMGRPAISDEDFEKEQERIRDAAQALFGQGGRDAITLRAISKAIGSSAMQPYRYFPGGKNEILATVKARAFDRFTAHMSKVSEQDLDDIEMLEAYCQSYVAFALSDPSSFKLMFEHEVEGEDEFPELAAAESRARQPVVELIKKVVQTRDIDEDPAKIGQILWASVHGLVSLHLSGQLKFGNTMGDLAPVLAKTLKAGLLSE